jgi:hypothetical protein
MASRGRSPDTSIFYCLPAGVDSHYQVGFGIFGWGSRLLLTAPPTVFSLVLASFHVQAFIRGDAAEQHRIHARQPIGVEGITMPKVQVHDDAEGTRVPEYPDPVRTAPIQRPRANR